MIIHAADDNSGFFPLPKAENFGDLPDPVGTSGTLGVQNLVDKVFDNVKYIIGTLAIALISFSGFRLVYGAFGEDQTTEQKKNLLYMILGFLLLGMALPLSQIFNFEDGGPFSDSYEIADRVKIFKNETMIVVTFIKYILGSIAVLFTVISGTKLVLAVKNEGALDEVKKQLGGSILGLIIVMFSGTFIDKVFYKVDLEKAAETSGLNPTIDVAAGISEIIGITNLIVTFIGPLLVLIFVGAGVYYAISFQDESHQETAKKWMKNAFIGLLVVYGAFALVSTFIAGNVNG